MKFRRALVASMKAFMAGLAGCLVTTAVALAQGTAEDLSKKAYEEAQQAARHGPVDLPLAGQGQLKLPEGHAFVPQPQAARLMQAMGNPGQDPRLLGLIFSRGAGGGWFMTVRYEDSGHIKDDDARDWNADELLKSYREGTEAGNEERQKMGVPAIEVLGWAEKPSYDAATHRLVWAMSSREKGAPAGEPQGVNYNTYVLGREGYFTLNLVTGLAELPQHKPAAHKLLATLDFDEGRRYADYNDSTDRTAEYGLAALVVGVAAKKLGLLALAGVFFAKFAKIIFLVLGAVGLAATKLFKGRKAKANAEPAAPPPL
jgi:uncharacterized membrane-anchored protein